MHCIILCSPLTKLHIKWSIYKKWIHWKKLFDDVTAPTWWRVKPLIQFFICLLSLSELDSYWFTGCCLVIVKQDITVRKMLFGLVWKARTQMCFSLTLCQTQRMLTSFMPQAFALILMACCIVVLLLPKICCLHSCWQKLLQGSAYN